MDDISSRLDDIESSISNLESGHGDWWWWIPFAVIGYLLVTFAFEGNFSIPKELPNKLKYTDVGETRQYHIIYNENFEGYANYEPMLERVTFVITNNGNYAIDFEDAQYRMWDINGWSNGLEVIDMYDYLTAEKKRFLNPLETIAIETKTTRSPPWNIEVVKGCNIRTKGSYNKYNIRFGYHKLGFWDKGRWLIAERIRKN